LAGLGDRDRPRRRPAAHPAGERYRRARRPRSPAARAREGGNMTSMDLDPVDRITAGAVGPPGQRTFYLQARKGDELATVMVEKQQVQLLSASILEILARVGKETGEGPGEELMQLEEPVEPKWRAGRLSIGYVEDRDLVLLEIDELLPEDESEEEEEEEEAEAEAEAGEDEPGDVVDEDIL